MSQHFKYLKTFLGHKFKRYCNIAFEKPHPLVLFCWIGQYYLRKGFHVYDEITKYSARTHISPLRCKFTARLYTLALIFVFDLDTYSFRLRLFKIYPLVSYLSATASTLSHVSAVFPAKLTSRCLF